MGQSNGYFRDPAISLNVKFGTLLLDGTSSNSEFGKIMAERSDSCSQQ